MKKIYLFAILLLSCITTFAQAPNYLWAKNAEGIYHDVGTKVVTDSSGNVLLTGYFESPTITFGTITLTNADNSGASSDIFFVKYDALGNVLWAKNAGGSEDDIATSISTDYDGNMVVTGHFKSSSITFGTISLSNTNSNNEFFLVKYNSSGNVLWAKSAKGNSIDYGSAVCVSKVGNIYVTGSFSSSNIIFGIDTLNRVDFYDVFLAKYDSSGNALWARRAGGTYTEYAYGISTDINENVVITGIFLSNSIAFDTITLINTDNTNATSDVFIAKYDASGNILWAQRAEGISSEIGTSVSTDSIGNIFLTGNFYSPTLIFTSTTLIKAGNNTTCDLFIVKYNSSGNVLWAKKAGGASDDHSSDIFSDSNGNILLTGHFLSTTITFETTTLTKVGGFDIFLVKYNTVGNVLWVKKAGGNSDDLGYSVCSDRNNNVFLTGFFKSPTITFGTTTLTETETGYGDCFLVKLDNITGIKEEFNLNNTINIFPNPASGQINIASSYNIDELIIKDLQGQIVYQSNPNDKNVSIQVNKKGVYFITLTSDNQSATKKLIVAN